MDIIATNFTVQKNAEFAGQNYDGQKGFVHGRVDSSFLFIHAFNSCFIAVVLFCFSRVGKNSSSFAILVI